MPPHITLPPCPLPPQNCSDPQMKMDFTVRVLPGTDTSAYSSTLAKALTSLGSVGGLVFCNPEMDNVTISTELKVRGWAGAVVG